MSKLKFLFIGLAMGLFMMACTPTVGDYNEPENPHGPIVNPDPNGGQENPNDNPDPNGGQENPPAVEYTYDFYVRLNSSDVRHINPKFESTQVTWGEIKALFLSLNYPQFAKWQYYEVGPKNPPIYQCQYEDSYYFSSSKSYYLEESKN